MMRRVLIVIFFMLMGIAAQAQVDRSEIRSGNRRYGKGDYRAAAVEYMRALDKDSTSFAGNYNLASVHYRLGAFDSAKESLEKLKDFAPESSHGADYYFNLGDVNIARKDWQGAVDALKQCLLLDPGNIDAKENYIYAKKHLENQQNQQQQQQQNQDQNQDQQNQDQNQDQQNQDQDKDQDKDQNKDQDKDQNGQQPKQQPAEAKVSPQQAQQMLQAIQAKEKNTQEKVEKAKAAVGVKKNEKNW